MELFAALMSSWFVRTCSTTITFRQVDLLRWHSLLSQNCFDPICHPIAVDDHDKLGDSNSEIHLISIMALRPHNDGW